MKNLLNFTRKAAAVVLGLACFAQVAHADALADIKARKKVLVAIDLGAPPRLQIFPGGRTRQRIDRQHPRGQAREQRIGQLQ